MSLRMALWTTCQQTIPIEKMTTRVRIVFTADPFYSSLESIQGSTRIELALRRRLSHLHLQQGSPEPTHQSYLEPISACLRALYAFKFFENFFDESPITMRMLPRSRKFPLITCSCRTFRSNSAISFRF